MPEYVTKRNGEKEAFSPEKIMDAIEASAAAANSPLTTTQRENVVSRLWNKTAEHEPIHVEVIQNLVIQSLNQYAPEVGAVYAEYRKAKAQARDETFYYLTPEGVKIDLAESEITAFIDCACRALIPVKERLPAITNVHDLLYPGMPESEFWVAFPLSVLPLIEQEPKWRFVAAYFVEQDIFEEVHQTLHGLAFKHYPYSNKWERHPQELINSNKSLSDLFSIYIRTGIKAGLLDEKMGHLFDLDKIGKAVDFTTWENPGPLDYLGIKTLQDRYLLRKDGQLIETPEFLYMRVAMGLALNESEPTDKAIEFFYLMASHRYMPSTPTLFNSGTTHPQLSSCYLSTVPDSIDGIYQNYHESASLSKYAGGLGVDWTPVRATGSHIKGTNGKSSGVIPFLKVFNDTLIAVNQGGKRRGSGCAYLEPWHLDVEAFLELRKNTGDHNRRTHDMNTALWVPDLFMHRLEQKQQWTLFSPDEANIPMSVLANEGLALPNDGSLSFWGRDDVDVQTINLHDLYGESFSRGYEWLEAEAEAGRIKNYKVLPATQLWIKMLTMLYETGHPWLTFKDACNLGSPQQHCGIVHSSNLCTEITLNTSDQETAVCNLGSINLPRHIDEGGRVDIGKLQETVKVAMRMLDNVIDINFYPTEKSARSNQRHRPVGLGLMGFQDALHKLGLSWATDADEIAAFSAYVQAHISCAAITGSAGLADERGKYPSFDGSDWSEIFFPDDKRRLPVSESMEDWETTIRELIYEFNFTNTRWYAVSPEWSIAQDAVAAYGMRNSNCMAIAPTATISNICGVSQSIEPDFGMHYVKGNMSGSFTTVNTYLVDALQKRGLWSAELLAEIKRHDGSIQNIESIPDDIKRQFLTAFEINPESLITAAVARQQFIDQSQSLNFYLGQPDPQKLDAMYRMAWASGLKTTYYLRSKGATKAAAIDDRQLQTIQATTSDACTDDVCEVCQ